MKLLRLVVRAFIAASLFGAAVPARAVVIEGVTPQGTFKTVGLDAQGNFKVAVASSAVTHVIVDGSVSVVPSTGSVFQVSGPAGGPVQTTGPGGAPLPVTVTGAFTVQVATAASSSSGQISVTSAGGGVVILPLDALRKQAIVCNNDASLTVWLGPSPVTTTSGIPLLAGGCMTPDSPASFVGQLNGVSTATVGGAAVSFIYFY